MEAQLEFESTKRKRIIDEVACRVDDHFQIFLITDILSLSTNDTVAFMRIEKETENEMENGETSGLKVTFQTSLLHQILVKIELEVEVCIAIATNKCDSCFTALLVLSKICSCTLQYASFH